MKKKEEKSAAVEEEQKSVKTKSEEENKGNEKKLSTKENVWQAVKFTLFSASAGIIQYGSTALFGLIGLTNNLYWLGYLLGLILSVVWNFTFNRKFTFKSANNVPVAMMLVACYYIVFTPLSLTAADLLARRCFVPELAVTAIMMIINFVTEFLYDRFVVFKDSINTNDIAKKQKDKDAVKNNENLAENHEKTNKINEKTEKEDK